MTAPEAMPHWISCKYKGFMLNLDPHGDGDYDVWLYDDEWDYDHGQVVQCLRKREAIADAKLVCDEIRAAYATREEFERDYEDQL